MNLQTAKFPNVFRYFSLQLIDARFIKIYSVRKYMYNQIIIICTYYVQVKPAYEFIYVLIIGEKHLNILT